MIFAALVGGIVGSRALLRRPELRRGQGRPARQPLLRLGLVWYGGAIGGAIAVLLWAWWRGFLGLTLLDLCAPALALGYAIGRFGCQLSGDGDYGKAWDGPWAMAYRDGTVPTDRRSTRPRSTRRWRWGSAPGCSGSCATASGPGSCSRIYLVYAGTERFLVEFLRRNDDVALGLTPAQLESLAMIVGRRASGSRVERRSRGVTRFRAAARPPLTPADGAPPRGRAQQPAVDRDHVAGDVGGPLRGEEGDQVAVLLGLPEPPGGDASSRAASIASSEPQFEASRSVAKRPVATC